MCTNVEEEGSAHTNLPAHECTDRTPNATNKSIHHLLLLPGSESSFTEITEYVHFSLIQSHGELHYKIE